jgi:hypothetical protein
MLIKNMFPARTGSPYRELHQPIIYGLLAHSHDWNSEGNEAFWAILDRIDKIYDDETIYPSQEMLHPRYSLDLMCVADLGTAYFSKRINMGPSIDKERRDAFGEHLEGGVKTLYTHQRERHDIVNKSYQSTIAALIERLTTRMAYEDRSLQPFAEYLRLATLWTSIGRVSLWKPEVFSEDVQNRPIVFRIKSPLS